MTIEILRMQLSQNAISPRGAEAMANITGKYGPTGEVVQQVKGESSKVADAAEELGMSKGHFHNKLDIAERKASQGRRTNLEALRQIIAAYADKMPDMPRETLLKGLVEKLQQFIKTSEEAGRGSSFTAEELRQALQELSDDPTHQFVALDLVREYFDGPAGSDEARGVIDQVKVEYEQSEVAQEVHAGFVASVLTQRTRKDEDDPGLMRAQYREMLRDAEDFGQIFDGLVKLGVMKTLLKQVLGNLLKEVGDDLESPGPTIDKGLLAVLMKELGRLKLMQTVFDDTAAIIKDIERILAHADKGKLTQTMLTSRMLNFASKRTVKLSDAQGLLAELQSDGEPASQVHLGNKLRNLHAELPDRVMPTLEARQQQTVMIMNLLTGLVSAEEDKYEATH
jgi:type III secretion system YopN/LcrE/InvE/MxiC family regulator